MATGGFRTLIVRLGKGGKGLQPSAGDTKGLRALLKSILADLADLKAHTHRFDGSLPAANSSVPQSDVADGGLTGGTPITFDAYTIE